MRKLLLLIAVALMTFCIACGAEKSKESSTMSSAKSSDAETVFPASSPSEKLPAATPSAIELSLSKMSSDELITFRDEINTAIRNSEDWQEVVVPQGTWIVGEDIPAGTWAVKCANDYFRTELSWGEVLGDDGESIDSSGRYSLFNYISNPTHKWYKGDGLLEYNFSVNDGDYIVVHNDEGSAVFMPYAGKPDFRFIKNNEAVSSSGASSSLNVDLPNLSYSELVALKEKINLEIWQSDMWQEVVVPQGTWVVGKDIPAGTWTVKCADNYFRCEISWGTKLEENGEGVGYSNRYSPFNYISNPNHEWYKGDGLLEYTFTVEDGDYIVVHDDEGVAIFMPSSGKPDLGFKK